MDSRINIIITNDILQIKELSFIEKGILCEIHNLERINKCYASNKHFSEIFGISERSATRAIKNIQKLGLIKCVYTTRTDRQIFSHTKFMIDKLSNMIDNLSSNDRQIGDIDKQEINKDKQIENSVYTENIKKEIRKKLNKLNK